MSKTYRVAYKIALKGNFEIEADSPEAAKQIAFSRLKQVVEETKVAKLCQYPGGLGMELVEAEDGIEIEKVDDATHNDWGIQLLSEKATK